MRARVNERRGRVTIDFEGRLVDARNQLGSLHSRFLFSITLFFLRISVILQGERSLLYQRRMRARPLTKTYVMLTLRVGCKTELFTLGARLFCLELLPLSRISIPFPPLLNPSCRSKYFSCIL